MNKICRSQNAFTLLEIIIVLVILGFMAGLAAPRLEKVYSSVQQSLQRSEVLLSIANLGYQAWLHQKTIVLSQYPPVSPDKRKSFDANIQQDDITSVLQLPKQWHVVADTPIRYKYNGLCYGGTLTVYFRELANRYILQPPYCVPKQIVRGP